MEKIQRLAEVKAITGLSRSSIYDLVKKGKFPLPIKLGERASGWIQGEVDDWIKSRIAASRPTSLNKGGKHDG